MTDNINIFCLLVLSNHSCVVGLRPQCSLLIVGWNMSMFDTMIKVIHVRPFSNSVLWLIIMTDSDAFGNFVSHTISGLTPPEGTILFIYFIILVDARWGMWSVIFFFLSFLGWHWRGFSTKCYHFVADAFGKTRLFKL